jgi:hypothetical protein
MVLAVIYLAEAAYLNQTHANVVTLPNSGGVLICLLVAAMVLIGLSLAKEELVHCNPFPWQLYSIMNHGWAVPSIN